MRLTDAGRALMVHAEAVLTRLDEAEQELGELAGLRRDRLRLASFRSAAAASMLGVLQECVTAKDPRVT